MSVRVCVRRSGAGSGERCLPIRLRPDFSVFSRVMREGLFTGPGVKRLGSVLSGPDFSDPINRADAVKGHYVFEIYGLGR